MSREYQFIHLGLIKSVALWVNVHRLAREIRGLYRIREMHFFSSLILSIFRGSKAFVVSQSWLPTCSQIKIISIDSHCV